MKDRILVVSRRGEESQQIKRQLIDEGFFFVEMATTAPEAIEQLNRQKVDLLLMNMETFTKKKIQLAQDLRAYGYRMPVLIMAKIIATNTYSVLKEMPSTVLLEKPYEVKDLTGIADKLIQGRMVSQRIFRRFYTDEQAQVELFKGGKAIESRIRNLSKGGAFIEYKGPEISVGEMLRLNIELKEVARHYEVNAKVVWSAKVSPWGADPGIGVEFVKSQVVYQNLLRKI